MYAVWLLGMWLAMMRHPRRTHPQIAAGSAPTRCAALLRSDDTYLLTGCCTCLGMCCPAAQTAMPSAQDKALLRFMKDFNYLYSSLCTVRGDTPPVLVHTM